MRYAEVTFTPGPEVYQGPRETFFDGLTRGRERVRRELGVELRWIFDIPRRTVTLLPDLPLADASPQHRILRERGKSREATQAYSSTPSRSSSFRPGAPPPL